VENQLEQLLLEAVQFLQQQQLIPPEVSPSIKVVRNRDSAHGDYTTPLAMTLAKSVGLEPIELAHHIIQALPDSSRLRAVEMAGPGFINFFLAYGELQIIVSDILVARERYGFTDALNSTRVLIAIVVADADSPADVNQGRRSVVGASQANLLAAAGCEVQCGYLTVDPDSSADGRWVSDSAINADDGDVQSRQFASAEAFFTAGVGQGFDQVLFVVGRDQQYFVERMRAVCTSQTGTQERLGFMLIGSTDVLTGDDSPKHAYSKAIVTFDQLIDMIGPDSAHYFCVMRRPGQRQQLDLALATSQSKENPVYNVQYAHARSCSALRTAKDQRVPCNETLGLANLSRLIAPDETELMTQLGAFPETLLSASRAREPHQVTMYLQELANGLNKYYEAQLWLIESPPLRNARLCLILAAQQVLSNGLRLINVSAPEVL